MAERLRRLRELVWPRLVEALRRDWLQTKYDLHVGRGHQMNQAAGDTLRQAAGRQTIPPIDRPNPPKEVGARFPEPRPGKAGA